MGMDVFDVIALTIHANNNTIVGKTTIQKLIYFHTVVIKNIDISEYTHYFYGPFNREVSVALEDMSEFSYIEQNIVSRYYETYKYTLTNNGIQYASTTKDQYPNEFKKISETTEICNKHCDLRSTRLSYAAKAYYVLTNSKNEFTEKYSVQDITTIAKDFDWNISDKDAEDGISLLQKLNLVST